MPNVNVDLIDEYDLTKPEIFEPYDLIGISVMTPQREESLNILNTIKKHYPNKKVAIGGPHALHYFRDVCNEKYDYVVPKDGQRSIIKILKDQTPKVDFDSMNAGEWAEQPKPDRTSDKARKFLLSYNYNLNGRKSGTMLTATGCPMVCRFCEDAGTTVRWSPLDKLKSEMDDLIDLGYKGVYLFDDLFAINMKKVEPIAQELKKRDLIYRCNGQANFFTKWGEDFAKLLAETGCQEIAFGHETGSQKILDSINKKTSIEQNYRSIEYAKKHGIKVKSFLMIGLPGETKETIADTEKFIQTGGMDDFQLAIYYPYKGTKIRDAIDNNENTQDLFFVKEGLGAYGQKGGKSESVVRTKELSSEDLLRIRDELVNKHHPNSHKQMWFHDIHLTSQSEYG